MQISRFVKIEKLILITDPKPLQYCILGLKKLNLRIKSSDYKTK